MKKLPGETECHGESEGTMICTTEAFIELGGNVARYTGETEVECYYYGCEGAAVGG